LVAGIDKPSFVGVSPDLSHIVYLIRNYAADGSIATSAIYAVPMSDINNSSPEPIRGSEGVLVTDDFVWLPDNSHITIAGIHLVDDDTKASESGLFVIDIEANEISFLVEDVIIFPILNRFFFSFKAPNLVHKQVLLY